MATLTNLTFNIKFDLISVPTLVLSGMPSLPSGATSKFTITLPDLYVNVITGSSFVLRLDSKGQVQLGEYNIVYEVTTSDLVKTTFTRLFQFNYTPVDLVMSENFDVFTPSLTYNDSTVYSASGYTNNTVTRNWTVVSSPTGTITASTQSCNLIKTSNYYDASYTVTLVSSVLYTSINYAYLTIDERITKVVSTYAQTPPTLFNLVSLISALKTRLNSLENTIQPYANTKASFEIAQSLFVHIIDKIRVNNTAGIYKDLKDLIIILSNEQIPTYVALNVPILPYDLSSYSKVTWGNIVGDITQQTDLWNYLQILNAHDTFVFNQSTASSVWDITHNMGKFPSVSIVDTAGDEVEGTVNHISNTRLTITFTAAFSGKAYLN